MTLENAFPFDFIMDQRRRSVTIMSTLSDITSSEISFNHIELLKILETKVFRIKFHDLSRETKKKILKF